MSLLTGHSSACLKCCSHFWIHSDHHILLFLDSFVSFIYLNLVNPTSSFTSNQGFVSGVVGPAEGLNFWSYWFNFNLSDKFSSSKNHPLKSNKPFYLIKVLKSLIRERNPIYSEADITIESKPKVSHSKMVEKIVVELKKNQMFV